MLRALGELARKFSTRTVLLHQVIAQSVGLNATDTRCLDLILFHPDGMLTPGRLAELSGLTTGAITHILDHLENKGFVERVRNADDRRRVFIRLRRESLDPLVPKYEALAKAYTNMVEHYTDSQLELILDYMEKMAQLSERLMADAIAARQED
ncbi:MAG: MarR family transcriptional regulator [Candidatus Acidiferrales bacterium]